ncbi:MAG: class I SAM-dependent methyltransferase, partial [Burkholderiaceae bacterium]
MRDADAGAIDAAAQAKGAQQSYASLVWGYRQAEAVAAMIHVGRELGLFEAMAGAGPLDADELATKTGLHPRWLLEWMRLQAAAKILVYEPVDRFMLPPEATDILANPASRAYAADSFTGGYPPEQIAGLIESFRTGIGRTYESEGPQAVRKSEARHIRTAEKQVVPVMIPALDGVQEKLERGALVADVGCGDGALAVALARAFPRSTIHAMDPNSHAIAHVDRLARQHGLDNLSTFVAPAERFPGEARYDLVITFDCIHDMTDPQAAIDEIHRRLEPDGTWFIKDIRSKPA